MISLLNLHTVLYCYCFIFGIRVLKICYGVTKGAITLEIVTRIFFFNILFPHVKFDMLNQGQFPGS